MSLLRIRAITFTCLAAAVGFAMLFFAAKHKAWLTSVAPFCEDPYDSVGSFAFQLAGVAGSLSLLRALRGYGVAGIPNAQALLALRGSAIVLLAIFVTVVADIVAMMRHLNAWTQSPTGKGLALFLGILVLATISGVILVLRAARNVAPNVCTPHWSRAAAIVGVGVVLLGSYPEGWRHSVSGAILAAIAGMVLLFVGVWGLAVVLLPQEIGRYEDLLDDMNQVFGRLGHRTSDRRQTANANRSRMLTLAGWLRANSWSSITVIAILGGAGLAFIEARGEGLPGTFSRAILVLSVFCGIEAAGIALGYAFFWRLIGLRHTWEEGAA